MSCRTYHFFFFLFFILTSADASKVQARVLLWNVAKLDSMRDNTSSQATRTLLYNARQICSLRPIAVTDKHIARSGDVHNFESLSIYYWPNPENPDGPYISRDGYYNPEYKLYDLPRLNLLRSNTTQLAQAFYITLDSIFLKAFISQIDTWFLLSDTRMNPHFEYGQFIPGRNGGKGCSAGIIDAYAFVDVLESIALVDSIAPLDSERISGLRKWFGDFADWMQHSEIGKGEAAASNNHGVAYDVTLFRFAYFLERTDICQSITKNFAKLRIKPQIQPNGTQPKELARTRAYNYSIYNLEHMLDFCIMQHRLGNNYINTNGKRIRSAINFLQQYVGNRSAFPYQEVSDWQMCERKLAELQRKCNELDRY